jgi:mono/diheme cytochrome c family protein
MVAYVYQLLAKMGYTHPIHVPLTHMPTGLVTGAFLLAAAAFLARRPVFAYSARHCVILAFVFLFPTVLLGYLDWQNYYAGAWIFPIRMKLLLAGVLLILLTIAIILGRGAKAESKVTLILYACCFVTVTGLGYFGGQLVFAGRAQVSPERLQAGAKLFATNCQPCHPDGGNVLNPNLPLKSSLRLTDFNTFLSHTRNPTRPDGGQALMPPFPASKISDQEQKELYEYITMVLIKKKNE